MPMPFGDLRNALQAAQGQPQATLVGSAETKQHLLGMRQKKLARLQALAGNARTIEEAQEINELVRELNQIDSELGWGSLSGQAAIERERARAGEQVEGFKGSMIPEPPPPPSTQAPVTPPDVTRPPKKKSSWNKIDPRSSESGL